MSNNQEETQISAAGSIDASQGRPLQWEGNSCRKAAASEKSSADSPQRGEEEPSPRRPGKEPEDTAEISKGLERENSGHAPGGSGSDSLRAFESALKDRINTRDAAPAAEKAPSPEKGREPVKDSLPQEAKKYQKYVEEAAAKYGMDPALINAVINHESGFNTDAESQAGAQGLMQLMPETAESLGVSDPSDPRQAIMGGTRYLKQLSDRFQGDLKKTLAAYNAGPGNVSRYGGVPPFAETKRYVENVMKTFQEYKGE
ncbi:MAG: lytic transglycosylase domain-containing protein [Candidatus Eremiobacteraeota bacterium]|nr:lytic transglycosylase domain-containing protein [Candidatus Eremiobacteraeota bacterium]